MATPLLRQLRPRLKSGHECTSQCTVYAVGGPLMLHAQLIPIMGNLKPFPLSFRFPVSLNVAIVTTRSVIPLDSILSQMPCSRKESICGVIKRTASNLESCFRKEISAPSAQSSGGLPSIQMIAPFFRSITSFFSICKAALSFSLKPSRASVFEKLSDENSTPGSCSAYG
jgi:hypothetical protein